MRGLSRHDEAEMSKGRGFGSPVQKSDQLKVSVPSHGHAAQRLCFLCEHRTLMVIALMILTMHSLDASIRRATENKIRNQISCSTSVKRTGTGFEHMAEPTAAHAVREMKGFYLMTEASSTTARLDSCAECGQRCKIRCMCGETAHPMIRDRSLSG